MAKPAYDAYLVHEIESNGEKKNIWTKVGVAFRNKKGLTLMLPPNLSVSGEVLLMEVKDDDKK